VRLAVEDWPFCENNDLRPSRFRNWIERVLFSVLPICPVRCCLTTLPGTPSLGPLSARSAGSLCT
jgi:hypothetical protein